MLNSFTSYIVKISKNKKIIFLILVRIETETMLDFGLRVN